MDRQQTGNPDSPPLACHPDHQPWALSSFLLQSTADSPTAPRWYPCLICLSSISSPFQQPQQGSGQRHIKGRKGLGPETTARGRGAGERREGSIPQEGSGVEIQMQEDRAHSLPPSDPSLLPVYPGLQFLKGFQGRVQSDTLLPGTHTHSTPFFGPYPLIAQHTVLLLTPSHMPALPLRGLHTAGCAAVTRDPHICPRSYTHTHTHS